MAPMLAIGAGKAERDRRSWVLLEQTMLKHRADFLPAKTSGGERQRAAIARAMANHPPLLLADEPTGNLDSVNSIKVAQFFRDYASSQGGGVLLATHNDEIARIADRVICMRDGHIIDGQ